MWIPLPWNLCWTVTVDWNTKNFQLERTQGQQQKSRSRGLIGDMDCPDPLRSLPSMTHIYTWSQHWPLIHSKKQLSFKESKFHCWTMNIQQAKSHIPSITNSKRHKHSHVLKTRKMSNLSLGFSVSVNILHIYIITNWACQVLFMFSSICLCTNCNESPSLFGLHYSH